MIMSWTGANVEKFESNVNACIEQEAAREACQARLGVGWRQARCMWMIYDDRYIYGFYLSICISILYISSVYICAYSVNVLCIHMCDDAQVSTKHERAPA